LQIEGFECQAFFFEAERFETLAHPATIVNQGLAVRQQLMSFALSALTLLWVCEDPAAAALSQLYTLETI